MNRTLLVLVFLSLLTIQTQACANEKEEIDAAFATWRRAISSGHAEKVVQLYDKQAILLATLAPKPITTQKGRLDYFAKLIAKPHIRTIVNEEYIRVLDHDNAVISGLYTFRFKKDGKIVKIPARFSLVYEHKHGRWLIMAHHSSKVPGSN